MAILAIRGGKALKGDIRLSGNKNASLPIIAASLLSSEAVVLKNVPAIRDVKRYLAFFDIIGVHYEYDEASETLKIYSFNPPDTLIIDYEPLTKMRASLFLMIPLLLKTKKVVYKGGITGCSLGFRPIDSFLKNLERFGAKISLQEDSYIFSLDRPEGGFIWQAETSVSSTEAAIMLAVFSSGKTVIYNAASEPHVQNLCHFLQSMGAKIDGIGSNRLTITGVNSLAGTEFVIGDDHHELATWLGLSAITQGDIKIHHNLDPIDHLQGIFNVFETLGVYIDTIKSNVKDQGYISYVKNADFKVKGIKTASMVRSIKVAPWPGFPVDLLPLLVPLVIYGDAPVMFHNWMYEAGLNWVYELSKAGVKVLIADPHRAVVFPSRNLRPATFVAPYIIRATVALIMTSLSIKGLSRVVNYDTIERAHPGFIDKLHSVGADCQIEE